MNVENSVGWLMMEIDTQFLDKTGGWSESLVSQPEL